jgi:hypothetical protein
MRNVASPTRGSPEGLPRSTVIDLRPAAPSGRNRLVDAGDEMAACLERFLVARVDERTLQRAHEALLRWSRLDETPPTCA